MSCGFIALQKAMLSQGCRKLYSHPYVFLRDKEKGDKRIL